MSFSSRVLWRNLERGGMLARAEVVLPKASEPRCFAIGWHEPDEGLFDGAGGVRDRVRGYRFEYLVEDCPDLCEGAECVIYGVESVAGRKFKVIEEPYVPIDGSTGGEFRFAPLSELRVS